MTAVLTASTLPLPLLRRGKVREVYEVDAQTLLLVASDRVSAFDVVMAEPVPHKGAVLTQLSAFWFDRLAGVMPHHCLTADADEITRRLPAIASHRAGLIGKRLLRVRKWVRSARSACSQSRAWRAPRTCGRPSAPASSRSSRMSRRHVA